MGIRRIAPSPASAGGSTRNAADHAARRTASRVMAVALLWLGVVASGNASAQSTDDAEWTKLQGVWTVAAGEQNGRPNDAIKGGTLTIRDRTFQLRTASGAEFKGQVRIDATQSPRHLDFVHENGPLWLAIYTLNGDVFRLNYVEAGEQRTRPTLFATSSGGPGSIVVMRRAAGETK